MLSFPRDFATAYEDVAQPQPKPTFTRHQKLI